MYLILFVLILGFIFGFIVSRFKYDGVIIVRTSDPSKDSYLFEIDKLDKLHSKKRVTLKIINRN